MSQLALAAALNPSLLLVARPASAAADLVALGGGAAEGALFGLLYRYVVRGDLTRPDPGLGFSVKQLGDGVVSSFALTSVLAHNQENLVKVAEVFVLSLPTAISDLTSVPEGGGALAAAGDVARALSSSPAAAAAAPPLLRDAAVAWLSFGLCREALDRALLSGAIAQAD
uniref:Queuosine salvage protein n=1 Tax=Heterosigma akashiwo TaxID=2829 RepID=A0A7S3URH4_HETAK